MLYIFLYSFFFFFFFPFFLHKISWRRFDCNFKSHAEASASAYLSPNLQYRSEHHRCLSDKSLFTWSCLHLFCLCWQSPSCPLFHTAFQSILSTFPSFSFYYVVFICLSIDMKLSFFIIVRRSYHFRVVQKPFR